VLQVFECMLFLLKLILLEAEQYIDLQVDIHLILIQIILILNLIK